MNAIRYNRIGVIENPDGSIDVVVPPGMAEDFKLLVKRGTNTYPSQHIEIRDFADRLLRPGIDTACMKQELFGYPKYPESNIIGAHWDIPSEDKMMIAQTEDSKESQAIVAKSLLRQSNDPLPEGCYCKPGQCAAPKPEWCRDAAKRDAKKDS